MLLLAVPVSLQSLPAKARCLMQGCAHRLVPVARLPCGAMRHEAVLRNLNKPVLAHAGAQGAPRSCGAPQDLPGPQGCQIASRQVPVRDYAVVQSLPGNAPAAWLLPGPKRRLRVVQHRRMPGLAHAAAPAVCFD